MPFFCPSFYVGYTAYELDQLLLFTSDAFTGHSAAFRLHPAGLVCADDRKVWHKPGAKRRVYGSYEADPGSANRHDDL